MGKSRNSITADWLNRQIGRSGCPVIFDVRRKEAFDGSDRMIKTAQWRNHERACGWAVDLPGLLKSRRLAMESAAIVRIADRLAGHLRRGDPLATRIELNKLEFMWCCARGAIRHVL